MSSSAVLKLLLGLACLASAGYLGYRYWQSRDAARLALLPRVETSADGATFRNRLNMEFVRIPAGKFIMGSPIGISDEIPPHEVKFAQPFYLGKYEVTLHQWEILTRGRPGKNQDDNAPVEQISWRDARDFVKRLNELNDGYVYRLPSEAEWEYAARAGEDGDYIRGLEEMAWHHGNAEGRTHPVGQKKPNAWGLHDVFGNVWEWCEDYPASYANAPTDGRAQIADQAAFDGPRSLRGYSVDALPQKIRVAFRSSNYANARKETIGLRLAASLKE